MIYNVHSPTGGYLSQEEEKIFTEAAGDISKLKLRACIVCDLERKCYNGWCARCLTEFKAINGRWPCQTKES